VTKILLFGATGQVGWELMRTLPVIGTVITPQRGSYDFENPDSLRQVVEQLRPQLIVNAAAYTAVDLAETEIKQAISVNAVATGVLAGLAHEHRALLVHYSSDYVFDGTKCQPYDEVDAPNPLSVYGQSKLAGDNAVAASGCDHLIFRTSWVYGSRGKNFLNTILRLLGQQMALRIVCDQIGAPTASRLIAEVTAHVLQQELVHRSRAGFSSKLLNLSSSGATSWHGFAEKIAVLAAKYPFPLACSEILSISTSDYPLPARRPGNSRLNCALVEQSYGLRMPSWDGQLQLVMEEILASGKLIASS